MRDANTEEKRKHSSRLVPFSYYKSIIPSYFANVPIHWHNEFEINYILSGQGEFICEDEKYVSGAGDIIILPPNIIHAIYSVNESELNYDTLVFSPEMLGSLGNDRSTAEFIRPLTNGLSKCNHRITAEHPYYAEIKTTVENIISCAKGNSALLDMLMKSELIRLFWLLNEGGDIVPCDEKRNGLSDLLRPALEYINENYTEDVTIEKLSETAHLSQSYFMSKFKQFAGISAIEYITQLRIKKACEMLLETDCTSAQAAFDCGFRNLSNFNRQFRKIMGCSPNKYRKTEHSL